MEISHCNLQSFQRWQGLWLVRVLMEMAWTPSARSFVCFHVSVWKERSSNFWGRRCRGSERAPPGPSRLVITRPAKGLGNSPCSSTLEKHLGAFSQAAAPLPAHRLSPCNFVGGLQDSVLRYYCTTLMLEQVLLRRPGGESAYFLQPYKSDVATKLLQCGFEGFFAFLWSMVTKSIFLC